ncbi:alpha tubulin suppressor [Cystobasidiomycetes sp. EMM_F5]
MQLQLGGTIMLQVNNFDVVAVHCRNLAFDHVYPHHMPSSLVLYAAGSNSHGQLGIGSTDDAHSFTRCPIDHVVENDQDCRIKIAAGAHHTLLLIRDGPRCTLLGAGLQPNHRSSLAFRPLSIRDLVGQLELPFEQENPVIVDVAAGWESTYIIVAPRDKPKESILICIAGRTQVVTGASTQESSVSAELITSPNNIVLKSVYAGPRHCLFVDIESHTYGIGAAKYGQLGSAAGQVSCSHPARVSSGQVQQVAVGSLHSVVLTDDATCMLYGSNKKGQLGHLDTAVSYNTLSGLVSAESGTVALKSVYATWKSTFVLGDDDEGTCLFSFGDNAFGQLGRDSKVIGDAGQVEIGLDLHKNIRGVAAGSEHVLALIDGNEESQVWGWGWNEHGNLGLGDANLLNQLRPIKLWTAGDFTGSVNSVHAGNGTSWIAILEHRD